MKIIYYRKENALYQKGIFIPLKILIGIMSVILVLFLYVYLPNTSITLSAIKMITVLMILLGIFIYLFNSNEKSEFLIIPNKHKSIDTYKYLKKRLKKKKGSPEIQNQKIKQIIGDNEFKSIIVYREELIAFYEECEYSIKELTKNGYDEISIVKTNRLKNEITYKKEILKSLSERK